MFLSFASLELINTGSLFFILLYVLNCVILDMVLTDRNSGLGDLVHTDRNSGLGSQVHTDRN